MKRIAKLSIMLATLCVAGAILSPQAKASTSTKKARKMNIGLELYTVRDACAKDFPGTLKAVAASGFMGVEFAGYYNYSAQDLKKMLDEDHLKCYGSHTPLDALLGDNLKKTIEFNKVLGNKLIVVPWIPTERRNTRAAILETCKLFNDLAEKLAKEGITLGYHNHMDEFKPIDNETPWDIFYGNTSDKVKVQFDIGNAMAAGAQAAPYLKKFPGRTISIHVKDHSATNPDALLGEGDENWADTIPLLKGNGAIKYFIIEQESYPIPSIQCAAKCLQNFHELLKKY